MNNSPDRIAENIPPREEITYRQFIEKIKYQYYYHDKDEVGEYWHVHIDRLYNALEDKWHEEYSILCQIKLEKHIPPKDTFVSVEEICFFFCPNITLPDFRKIQEFLFRPYFVHINSANADAIGYTCLLRELYWTLRNMGYKVTIPKQEEKKDEGNKSIN